MRKGSRVRGKHERRKKLNDKANSIGAHFHKRWLSRVRGVQPTEKTKTEAL